MMLKDLQQEILRIKKERDVCILAHSYMSEEICEVADFTGDSYALSVKAKTAPQSTVVMCGVRFMAETVKMLSPQKKVILANPDAGCPMAEQMDKDLILQLKESMPDYTVVAYVNTTAELKTVCDVCVTSSSAVKICRALPSKNILFIPDINLGTYVKNQIPEKNFRRLPYPRQNDQGRRVEGQGRPPRSSLSGSPRVQARSYGLRRLRRFHHGHNGLCRKVG